MNDYNSYNRRHQTLKIYNYSKSYLKSGSCHIVLYSQRVFPDEAHRRRKGLGFSSCAVPLTQVSLASISECGSGSLTVECCTAKVRGMVEVCASARFVRVKTCDKCGVRSVEAHEETTSGSSSRSGVQNERVCSSSQSRVETLNRTRGSSSQY